MADWDPVSPDYEWNPANAEATPGVPNGSITNEKLRGDIDPRKITGFGMKVCLSAQQSVATGVQEVVEFDTEVFRTKFDPIDTFSIPVPYDGIYSITAGVDWTGGVGDVDDERGFITINGDPVQGNASPNLTVNRQRYTMATTTPLVAGDLVGFEVKHGSAGARNLGASDPTANNLTVVYLFTI